MRKSFMNKITDILQNAAFARIVMIILIAFSIVFGARRSLSSLVAEAENVFYQGEYGDGLGVAEDIKRCRECTSNLLVIGRNAFGQEGTESMKVLEAQIKRMKAVEDPSGQLRELKELTENLKPYYQELQKADLSDYDRGQCNKLIRDIEENIERITRDSYQKAVREVNQKLNTFPASILKYAAGVMELEEW